jgi:hypothetical protein
MQRMSAWPGNARALLRLGLGFNHPHPQARGSTSCQQAAVNKQQTNSKHKTQVWQVAPKKQKQKQCESWKWKWKVS